MALSSSNTVLRTIGYGKNFRSVTSTINKIKQKNFSTYESFDDKHTTSAWPDPDLGPLNTPNKNFSLPGDIGLKDVKVIETGNPAIEKDTSIVDDLVAENQQSFVISQLLAEGDYLEGNFDTSMSSQYQDVIKNYLKDSKLEVAIQDCPKVLIKDTLSLFPGFTPEIKDNPEGFTMTIVTLTQKAENDMTMWSSEVDEEREKLLENFISSAMEISHLFRSQNFWYDFYSRIPLLISSHWHKKMLPHSPKILIKCDFIDPSCGQAYFGNYTNDALFETDERYRHLGFDIEDLGCCKVIMHKQWGSHAYVGSIFTNAPKNHPIFKTLLKCLE